jgi:TolA-binding protein
MRLGNSARIGVVLLVAAALAACASTKRNAADNAPTLKSLEKRQVAIAADQVVDSNEEKAIAAYQDFLKAAPRDSQRLEALRRLGDLEMDSADARSASGPGGAPDYRGAIARYREFLKTYPNDPNNDRVLYQLARAYELGGQLETALATLDSLVQKYPRTKYRDEAQFRRGELLFTTRDYRGAEKAFTTVLRSESQTPYHERSLYMHGWSLYKQGRLEDGLKSFFGVLDLKLAGRDSDVELAKLSGLTRADFELVEDTFRVVSLSLQNLQGAESIAAYIDSPARRGYEFRVYQELGELYLKQERIKDAADTFAAFARRNPLHPQAPVLQARVIDIYQSNGFATLALDGKKEYVERYGIESELRKTNPAGWERAQPLVKMHLAELAQHHHAAAQKSKKPEDYQEAARWYREYLTSFPQDPQAAQSNFLLAELLFESKQFDQAAVEYEKAAYAYPAHARSADAGYAALLAYAEQDKRGAADAGKLKLAAIESELKFARTFPKDPRAGAVLTNAAEKLYALRDVERAEAVAQQVLALDPPAGAPQRRVASLVLAHAAFDRNAFDQAEKMYGAVLALTDEKDGSRKDLTERLAASIYKQGELARSAGRLREAVAHFERVATVVPQSTVRATAQYDAAAALLTLKDWDRAARTLEDFRRSYPNHPLAQDAAAKLAVAYTEKGQWAQAAAEFDRIFTTQKDPQLARAALWQSAELYEKGGASAAAAKAYERYAKTYREPFEANLEARYRLALLARKEGNAARHLAGMKDVLRADQTAGSARTDRTRYLGAQAALALAEPLRDSYRSVALVEPLQKNLKLKKARMEEVLKAYALAAEYGVAEVATAATFQTAELYGEFGKAMLGSQRPKGLKKVELEQYNVLLEEQAFPFEEKAIELHEANARRSAKGIYDKWVQASYAALGKLRPVRYAKSERSEGTIDAIR